MYVIRYPRVSRPTKVIGAKFVAVGEAVPGHRNLLGFLKRGGEHVAVARTLREPHDAGSKLWWMVFDLRGVDGVDTELFALTINRLLPSGQLREEASLERVRFQVVGRVTPARTPPGYGVNVIYPDPSTPHCHLSFSPYGELTYPDTRVESVKLYAADGTTLVDTADLIQVDPDLFWCATFDEVPQGNDYVLKVQGNSSSSPDIGDLDFASGNC